MLRRRKRFSAIKSFSTRAVPRAAEEVRFPTWPFFRPGKIKVMTEFRKDRSFHLAPVLRIPAVSLLTCFFLYLAVAGCSGPPKRATWSNATGAEQYERLMWQSIRDKNWNQYSRRLAPTFVGVAADGRVFDRQGWVDYWKARAIKDFSLGDVQVQPEGPDMVVTYVLHLEETSGSASSAGVRVVSVWQQVKSGWMLTASSMTPIQS